MSSIVIAGDTSGSVTLAAPAVAGTVTVTLPSASGTMATTAGLSSYATLATPSFTSTIGVGSATASASGAGITFPSTQSASSDANTLDDYEEGTWSASGITAINCTGASFSEGLYTKIGNIVHIQGKFTLTITTANTLTYVNMAAPFTPVNIISGSLMDNGSLIAGAGQVHSNGQAYAFFAASASEPAGATTWYINAQYQV